jgi:uncharacterized membrane protein
MIKLCCGCIPVYIKIYINEKNMSTYSLSVIGLLVVVVVVCVVGMIVPNGGL